MIKNEPKFIQQEEQNKDGSGYKPGKKKKEPQEFLLVSLLSKLLNLNFNLRRQGYILA